MTIIEYLVYKMLDETILKYLKISLVAIVASYVSFSHTKNPKEPFKFFFNRTVEGCFCGYVSFEIAFYNLKDINLCLAVCGVGAFFGVKIFDWIKEFLIKFADSKIPKNQSESGDDNTKDL